MAPAAVQPDIDYEPDFEKYQRRTKLRLENQDEGTKNALPAGFPHKLVSDLVWDGKDFPAPGSGTEPWVHNLSAGELEEIDQALAHFKSPFYPLVTPWRPE